MADGLTENEAQHLDRDGHLIRDLRDGKSQAHRVSSPLQVENPARPVRVAAQAQHGRTLPGAGGTVQLLRSEPDGLATVVKADGEHATANYKVHGLFHGARAEAFRKWFDNCRTSRLW